MRFSLALVVIPVLAVSCGKKGGGEGDGDGAGIVVGKLAPRELKSPDGKTTVKGSFPENWTTKNGLDPTAVRVEQADGDVAIAHVQVGPSLLATRPPKELASDVASTESAYGKGSVVASGVEIAPGRFAKVAKMGMQWKPGIEMFEVHVYWGEPPTAAKPTGYVVDCWVGWKGKTADGATDLCKDLEVAVAR
jgi:hypothetical protein